MLKDVGFVFMLLLTEHRSSDGILWIIRVLAKESLHISGASMALFPGYRGGGGGLRHPESGALRPSRWRPAAISSQPTLSRSQGSQVTQARDPCAETERARKAGGWTRCRPRRAEAAHVPPAPLAAGTLLPARRQWRRRECARGSKVGGPSLGSRRVPCTCPRALSGDEDAKLRARPRESSARCHRPQTARVAWRSTSSHPRGRLVKRFN